MYFLPTAHNRRYKVERDIVEKLLSSVIQQSKNVIASSKKDGSKSKNIRDKFNLIQRSEDNSADALIDMMNTTLFAGYETTAITITFVLYNLTKYPEFQERCNEEAQRVLQREDDITIMISGLHERRLWSLCG